MSHQESDDDTEIERRTFMKGVGATASATALGLSAGTAAAHGGFHAGHANFRVQEARKAWKRGYRGRPNRSIGITDSGIDARHPDLGPWNGVRAVPQDGELTLTGIAKVPTGRSISESGSAGPGTVATGDEFVITEFDVPAGSGEPADLLNARLSWSLSTENANDLELRLDRRVGEGEWEEVASSATADHPERLVDIPLTTGTYRFVAEQFKNLDSEYELTAVFYDERDGGPGTFSADDLFDDDGTPRQLLPDSEAGDGVPKTIGWFNQRERYTVANRPRDGDGHGSHCSSIMAGSGRATVPEPVSEGLVKAEPRTVLTAGDFLEYSFTAEAGTGVFASAFGDAIELEIEGPDGSTLDVSTVNSEDASTFDNNIAEAPARTTGEYTVYVRPAEGEMVSTGRVETLRAGPLEDPTETRGDRDADGDPSVHAGVAPDASLVGLEGLGDPTLSLAEYAEQFSSVFNMRSVNMSWGYVGGLPLGAAGGATSTGPFFDNIVAAIKEIAEAGILTVAAAGNARTPANGNGAPAVADEALSVVATGPLDGISSYSSGGLGALDEDGGTYMKPDVTAPGGYDNNEVNAALGKDRSGEEFGDVRDYVVKAGTSMASPYACGTTALAAEAMEFDAPDSIALPAPTETTFEDVMRLKQVVLATATETAFTAAPYHRAKAPTYEFGGRDPYEGYGRVNPDAAVDAVSNDLFDPTSPAFDVESPAAATPLETDDDGQDGPAAVSTTLGGQVGLNVPTDSRALAGYVEAKGGTLDVAVEVDGLTGGNSGMAKGSTHVDLFVYDAEEPAENGEPNIVERAMGMNGSASLSVDVDAREYESDQPNTRTFYVVAKLVNVPGVVTGYDVQANLTLDLSFEAADVAVEPPEEVDLEAEGSRSDDGAVFTGGQSNRVVVTVEDFNETLTDAVRVRDTVPDGWKVDENFGDVESFEDGTVLFEPTVTTDQVADDRTVDLVYFAEAPEGAARTGTYGFGPAEAEAVNPATFEDDPDRTQGSTSEEFGGTDTNTVVGPSTEP